MYDDKFWPCKLQGITIFSTYTLYLSFSVIANAILFEGLLRDGNLICGGRGWVVLAFNDSNFAKILESERASLRDKSHSALNEKNYTSNDCLNPLTFPFVDENTTSGIKCRFDRVDNSRVKFQDASAIILEKSIHQVTYAGQSEGKVL